MRMLALLSEPPTIQEKPEIFKQNLNHFRLVVNSAEKHKKKAYQEQQPSGMADQLA